jgi:hypothetical protein
LFDQTNALQPAHAGQTDIEQDQIRRFTLREGSEGLLTRIEVTRASQVTLRAEQAAKRAAEGGVVFDDDKTSTCDVADDDASSCGGSDVDPSSDNASAPADDVVVRFLFLFLFLLLLSSLTKDDDPLPAVESPILTKPPRQFSSLHLFFSSSLMMT